MSGYAEGKHNDPVDNKDRLVRIGTKYQATAPAVADGDNVFLLVDAAGRPLITGPVASDAVAAGNPVPTGGDVDDTSPAAAAEGDRRVFRATPEGNQIVELYKDNNALTPIAAMPGAGEVIAKRISSGDPDSTGVTDITPTSGKKIRVISIQIWNVDTTDTLLEVYFGTGTNINTNTDKGIFEADISDFSINTNWHSKIWPDGAGPVGAVDDVVSVRGSVDINSGIRGQLHYREE